MKKHLRKYVKRESLDRWENGSAGKPQRATIGREKNKQKFSQKYLESERE